MLLLYVKGCGWSEAWKVCAAVSYHPWEDKAAYDHHKKSLRLCCVCN